MKKKTDKPAEPEAKSAQKSDNKKSPKPMTKPVEKHAKKNNLKPKPVAQNDKNPKPAQKINPKPAAQKDTKPDSGTPDDPKNPKQDAQPAPQPDAQNNIKPDAQKDPTQNATDSPKPGTKDNQKPKPEDDLKSLPLAEVEKKLGSSPDGLSEAEAKKRLTQYGPNEIKEKKTNQILKFLSYFWGPIPWMIEGAVILSAVVKHWLDFIIIFVLLLSNAIVGFWEEHQAGNAIEALKARLAIKAKVKRDGKWTNPLSSELVPGDVIRVRLGDIVPADARLLDGDPVEVDQSALTGESLPATRNTGEAIFSGSIIRKGEADAMVYATGINTYFGKTAQLVQEAHTVSHFQKAVLKIGNYLIILAVTLVALIITVAIFRGDPILNTIEFALILLVAAIPVAMPTVLSVTMAVGARLLAKKEAIVTRLAAIEELAGVDILCSDKTGTLTENKLTLGDPFTIEGVTADQVILYGALASRAEDKDTIDLAVIGGVKDNKALNEYKVIHFQPFDPVHKRTEATVKTADGKQFFVAKGAPQVIMQMSTNAPAVKAAEEKAVNDFASRGFRSLGVAMANTEGQWKLVGVLPLFDPPRPQAKETIANARDMGVTIKMVTGDQVAIAKEMARELGMGTNILDAAGLGDVKKDESAEAGKTIEQADGFAQVFPEHKFHIVDVLQKLGHIVGMTGDGVNDAPALKKADCGIAVSGATDAARAAASIVLLAPGLSVIIDAIKESRRIFQRMNSYAIYRIAETLRVLLLMTLAILVFNFYPVTAVMIVMLALLNDGAILSIAYDNVHYKNAPEAWNMRLVLGISTVLGVIGVIAAFGLFFLGDRVFHIDRDQLQTLMYLKLSVAGHLTIFLTRTRGPFWSIKPAKILWMAVLGTQIIATLIAVYGIFMTPLGWGWAGFVWGYAIIWALMTDRVKLLAYKILDRTKPNADPKSGAANTNASSELTHDAKPDANAAPATDKTNKDENKADTKQEGQQEAGTGAATVAASKPDDKPDQKSGDKPQGQTASAPKSDDDPDQKPATQPEASDKAPTPGSKTQATPAPKPEDQPVPKSNDKPVSKPEAAEVPEVESKPEDKASHDPEAKTTTGPELTDEEHALLKMTLGDVLLSGLLKDPKDAGRLIANAITDAEADGADDPKEDKDKEKPKKDDSPKTKP